MNRLIIKGHLTRDPELKTGGTGTEYCRFTVAVNRRRVKDKPQETDFFDCTAFNNTGVAISKFFSKGKEILLEGRMESSKSDNDGVKRTFWGMTVDNFEFCGGKSDSGTPAPAVDAESGMTKVETEDLPF